MLRDVSRSSRIVALAPLWLLVACGHAAMDTGGTIPIPAGHFTMGSSPYDRALALATNDVERAFLKRRLREMAD